MVVETTPVDESWSGTTSRGKAVSFTVSGAGKEWSVFSLATDFSVSAPPCGSASGAIEGILAGPGTITADHMSQAGSTFSMTGDFASSTTAEGTYAFTNYPIVVNAPYPPFECVAYFNQTGTWTAAVP